MVDGVGKEMKERELTYADSIDIVRPINHQPAPDHDSQDWEVDPMSPARDQLMFVLQAFQRRSPWCLLLCIHHGYMIAKRGFIPLQCRLLLNHFIQLREDLDQSRPERDQNHGREDEEKHGKDQFDADLASLFVGLLTKANAQEFDVGS